MTQERPETTLSDSGLTLWVGRLMLANTVVFVITRTLLTAPAVIGLFRFDPDTALYRPWTILSYMFVHEGVFQFASAVLLLFVAGPVVERKLGGRAFLFFYLYCGAGAAALAAGLSSFVVLPPLSGAMGAALSLAVGFAFAKPDTELMLFPIPVRTTARATVTLLAAAYLTIAVTIAVLSNDPGLHPAGIGGMVAAYLFCRVQTLLGRKPRKTTRTITRRAVMTPIPVRQGTVAEVGPTAPQEEMPEGYPSAEVDRVLDKISALGIHSLTQDERRFLDEVAKKKRER